jgi:hypothetical protein
VVAGHRQHIADASALKLGQQPGVGLVGDTRDRQAFRILDPASGHRQLPVDHGVPGIGGVEQVDGDLGVLDVAGGAGVLALHPTV